MLSKDAIHNLSETIAGRFTELNTMYLQKIGEQIRKIGKLSPSDAHKLVQMHTYGADIAEISEKLSEISGKSYKDIQSIFERMAKDNIDFAEGFCLENGLPFVPYEENILLQRYVNALSRQTADTLINLSQTTGFMTTDAHGRKQYTSLSQTYYDTVDKAVTAVSTGQKDYHAAMRKTLKSLADSGIRTKYTPLTGPAGKTANYATGYSRRLDTAVRQNILWGVKEINTHIQKQIGDTFGSDGWEVDYHRNPRPTHADMGGKQFVIGEGREIDGIWFDSFEDKAESLLSEYGCLHFKFPIVCGISEPIYSPEQLQQWKEEDKRTFAYEGKTYTGYEATQVQRKLETAIRHAKDRQIIASSSGDDTLRRQEQLKINALTEEYRKFSTAVKLPIKKDRIQVSGYRKAKAPGKVEPSENRLLQTTMANDILIKAGVVPEGVTLEKVRIMAGYGSSAKLRNTPRLSATYSGEQYKWAKMTGTVFGKYHSYEIHWYENDGVQHEPKIKRSKDL